MFYNTLKRLVSFIVMSSNVSVSVSNGHRALPEKATKIVSNFPLPGTYDRVLSFSFSSGHTKQRCCEWISKVISMPWRSMTHSEFIIYACWVDVLFHRIRCVRCNWNTLFAIENINSTTMNNNNNNNDASNGVKLLPIAHLGSTHFYYLSILIHPVYLLFMLFLWYHTLWQVHMIQWRTMS